MASSHSSKREVRVGLALVRAALPHLQLKGRQKVRCCLACTLPPPPPTLPYNFPKFMFFGPAFAACHATRAALSFTGSTNNSATLTIYQMTHKHTVVIQRKGTHNCSQAWLLQQVHTFLGLAGSICPALASKLQPKTPVE